jgi:hypothetical protein
MKNLEPELDELFRAYRQSFADVDPSAGFMPGVWEKIEARRSLAFRVTHLARAFLGATAVLFTLMAGIFVLAGERTTPEPHESYLDSLASAHATDSMMESMHAETGETNPQ